jgi:glycosyltransferase involved in cell wall biosynthesis
MHIAIVTETYPPEVNGVALTVQGLERGLRTLGHEVSLIRPRQAGPAVATGADELLVPGAGVPRYPGLRFGLPAGDRLLSRWRARRPDAIYVATEGPLGWSALRSARRLGIPVASGFHTRFDDYAARYAARFLAPIVFAGMRRFHNQATATLVPTEELAGQLRARGFRRVELLRRAVDAGHFDPAQRDDALRARWGLGRSGLAVIHVGRIAAEKNLELAVRAFRAIQLQRPDARFVFVGDGPVRSALQAENPDFEFTGTLRGADLARHFASADLFLFPSLSETFGNVTLEAMASGVATVAYDYGAAREHLRSEVHGTAVPCGDESAFVAAACRLAGDDEHRHRCGLAARRAVMTLDPASVSQHFSDLLQSLSQQAAA